MGPNETTSLLPPDAELTSHAKSESVRLAYVFPAIAVGVFLASADQTLIVSSYGVIGSDLKALNNTSWIASAYFLTLTAFQPLYGKISDIFGRKNALLSAYIIFGIGALACGFAQNIQQLVAARAFAGIGGGGMTTVVSVLLSDIVPLRKRGTWQGYINIIWATGGGCGAPLGGLIADKTSWRWSFIGQAPLCAIAIATVSLAIHLPPLPSQSLPLRQKIARIDFLGAIILALVVFSLLVGLDHGSNYQWKSPLTIGALVGTIPLFLLFCYVERYVALEPSTPSYLIFTAGHLPQYLLNFCLFAGHFGVIFFIPLYYQVWMSISAGGTGLLLIPPVVGGVCGSLFAGKVMYVTGRYFKLTLLAHLFWPLSVMAIIVGIVSFGGNIYLLSTALTVMGFCIGISLTSTLIALIVNSKQSELAVVTATSYLFRAAGSLIGASGGGVIVQVVLRATLRRRLSVLQVTEGDIEKIMQGVRRSLTSMDHMDLIIKTAVRESYRDAVILSLFFPAILGSCGFIIALWMREKKLDR
ncbi:MAG: hypothetical protein M1814_000121 [Vezdaea aestivalis]|nr:MAG: hypothetical protein M1814_000121 [Vezdaea aestivalis]